MLRSLNGRLLAAAIVLAGVPASIAVPAQAQISASISFDTFHDQLSPFGVWVYSDRWGTVWQPDVAGDFRPYDTGGHWENTNEYGWTWVSDYDWGDIAFHYGRWVDDPDDGWLWIPGYVWSPAWVVWRSNDDYVGWMAMPPDDNFLSGRADIGISASWNDPDRNYSNWYGSRHPGTGSMWVFVNFGHIADRDYHRYSVRRDRVPVLVRQTRNITNYTVVNNYVVNRSVDVRRVERFSGRSIRPVAASQVIRHRNLIGSVTRGDQVRNQMLQQAPRGTGRANSAPVPSQVIVDKLSDRTLRSGGRSNLFNKSTINQAGDRFRGGKGRQNATGTPPAAMPNGLTPQDRAPHDVQNPPAQNGASVAPATTTNGPGPQHRSRMPRGVQNPPVQNGANLPVVPRNSGPDAIPGPGGQSQPNESNERMGGHLPNKPIIQMAPAGSPAPDKTDQRRGLRMQRTAPPVAPQVESTPGGSETPRTPRLERSTPNVQVPPASSAPDTTGPGQHNARRGHPPDEPGSPPPKRGEDEKKRPHTEAPPQ